MHRFSSSSIFVVTGILLTALACSSKDDAGPGGVSPEASTSSSGGSSGEDDASTSSTSSSGSTQDVVTPPIVWVNTTTVMLEHEGQQRKYILSVPKSYDAAKKYPLYIWLHGNPGTAEGAATIALETVTHDEAIIAYPGSLMADGWDHSCSVADNADSTFLFAMIDDIATKQSIDKTKILLSGWSGGGFMSSSMACRFYASFKAIGIHAGGAPYLDAGGNPDCDGATIPTLVTHGGQDGATGGDSGFYAAEFWRQHNGCDSTTTATTPAPCVTYDNCNAGKPVQYCLRPQGGHELWDQAITVEWAWFKALP